MAYARMDYRWTCVRVEYSRKWEQNTRGCVYTRAYSCPLYRIMSWVMCFLRILEEVNARCLWIWSSAAAYFPLSIPIVIFTVAVSLIMIIIALFCLMKNRWIYIFPDLRLVRFKLNRLRMVYELLYHDTWSLYRKYIKNVKASYLKVL